MRFISNLIIFLAISSLVACTDKKDPPLLGTRLNVLHYDLLKEEKPIKVNVNLPPQISLSVWPASDTTQFTGVPANIQLAKNLKFTQEFNPKSFNPTSLDSASLIAEDIFYSYSKTVLSAYQISTKKELWSVKAVASNEIGDVINGSIAYHQGVIYLASGGRDFVAFNAGSGKELWRFRSPNIVRYIATITNKQIYISSIDNALSCLTLDGKLLWRYGAAIYSLTNDHLYMPNLEYADKVITVTTAGDLVALNRNDGEELTQVNLATTSIIGDGSLAKGPISSPILNGHDLYVLTGENDLIKINLENPEILWSQNFSGAKSYWVAGEITYLITDDNQLLAVENKQGKMIWVIDLPKNPLKKKLDTFYGPILAGDQLIVTAANGAFFLISPYDGKLIASYKNKFPTNQMPIIVNDKVYFISNKGNIAVWQ